MRIVDGAETVLKKLGITEPQEINLEVIAWDNDALIKVRPLSGCEARIVGNGNKGIISINAESGQPRQRFSAAHELGHWMLHRGESFMCRSEDIGNPQGNTSQKEREADNFAADLILPHYMLRQSVKQFAKMDFETVRDIADAYSTSLTATSIRLVEGNYFPAIVICHTLEKRKWFKRAKDVPSRWFPRDNLEIESYAFDILYGGKTDAVRQRRSPASAWFDRGEAENYEVFEHTIKIGDESLTILELVDDDMLEDECVGRMEDMADIRFR